MKKRHSGPQIVAKLRQADVLLGQGKAVPEVCREIEVSEQTYYRWRQKYGGMAPEMARQMTALGSHCQVGITSAQLHHLAFRRLRFSVACIAVPPSRRGHQETFGWPMTASGLAAGRSAAANPKSFVPQMLWKAYSPYTTVLSRA